jgi:deoxycytidine triphosphate deaminase
LIVRQSRRFACGRHPVVFVHALEAGHRVDQRAGGAVGVEQGAGARGVLEVRSRDVPFIIEDGQVVGRLIYERMAQTPRSLYGAGLASNYQAQGLKLSKHFRP